jgi:DNA-binding NarL/FixJ family response regulator
LIPGTEQENLLVPALDRDVAIGTLVLIIKTTSILKHDEVMPRASRLIQEALSSIVQKSNFNAVSTQRENRDFNPELLSPRQKEILALVAKELTSLQIARSLNVSESLVKKELVTMYKALGTLNRSETILRYRQYQSTPWGEVHLAPPPIFEANGVR